MYRLGDMHEDLISEIARCIMPLPQTYTYGSRVFQGLVFLYSGKGMNYQNCCLASISASLVITQPLVPLPKWHLGRLMDGLMKVIMSI